MAIALIRFSLLPVMRNRELHGDVVKQDRHKTHNVQPHRYKPLRSLNSASHPTMPKYQSRRRVL